MEAVGVYRSLLLWGVAREDTAESSKEQTLSSRGLFLPPLVGDCTLPRAPSQPCCLSLPGMGLIFPGAAIFLLVPLCCGTFSF